MADQTTLPTCTPGSLGPTKLDRTGVVDPYRDESAAQVNLKNLCIEEMFRRLGLSVGPAAGSIEARVTELCDHKRLEFREPFLGAAAAVLRAPWGTVGGGDWHYTGGLRGGAQGTLDAIDLAVLTPTSLDRTQAPQLLLSSLVTGSPGSGLTYQFVDDTGNEAVGVRFIGAANAIQAFLRTGGVETVTTQIGIWAGSTEDDLDLVVSAAGAFTVALNGGAPVAIGTLAASPVSLVMVTSADGDAGKLAIARNLLLRANWT